MYIIREQNLIDLRGETNKYPEQLETSIFLPQYLKRTGTLKVQQRLEQHSQLMFIEHPNQQQQNKNLYTAHEMFTKIAYLLNQEWVLTTTTKKLYIVHSLITVELNKKWKPKMKKKVGTLTISDFWG